MSDTGPEPTDAAPGVDDTSTPTSVPEGIDPVEWAQHAAALSARFSRHVEAAADAVRSAQQHLTRVRAELERAQDVAAHRRYTSDRLVFMRASVHDELEALDRKTTPKKVRIAYRHLVARAVELAEGEVAGYHDDEASAAREREQSVDAWLAAEREARHRLEAATAMQARVVDAERAARRGLSIMLAKTAAGDGSDTSA